MKNLKLFLLTLMAAAIFVSCDEDNGDDDKKIICKIVSEMIQGDDYSSFVYDESGLLVKINHSNTPTTDIYGYDTLIYSSGQLTTIKSYSTGSATANETITFTYTSGKITKIVDNGPEWDEESQQDVSHVVLDSLIV